MGAMAVSSAADLVSVVIRQALVELDTVDAMRGREGAINSMFIGAFSQLGEFDSDATAALMGPVASVVLGGLAMPVAALGLRLFRATAQRDALVQAGTAEPGGRAQA